MTHLKKIIRTVTFILFSIIPVAGYTYTANTILAKVNDKNITLGHVIAAVARLPQEYNNLDSDYLLEGVLDQIIKQEIIAQTLNISQLLTKVSLENEIRSIKAKYAVEKQMIGFPTNAMIENAYKEETSVLEKIEEFNASHILVETEESALEVLELLKSGMEFEKIAQEKSTGPSGPNGGNLGWFGMGQMVPEFETAVMVLEVGKVSQPVKTQFGWHIIRLNNHRFKPLPTREDLEPELIQKLSQSRIDELVRVKSEEATIELLNKNVDSSLIRNLELLGSKN